MSPRPIPLADRFWAFVDVREPDECWPWLGGRRAAKDGAYGIFSIDGKQVRAHRVAYKLANGPLGDDENACHSCDNPPCCNPSHLWRGTNGMNNLDCRIKGRNVRGKSHGNAKLTDADVQAILADVRTHREIALDYGINRGNVSLIKRRKLWAHVAGTPETRPTNKMTAERAAAIRSADGSQQDIGKRFGTNQSMVSKIKLHKVWWPAEAAA